MKTQELITMLAQEAGPAPKKLFIKRLLPATIIGASVALAIVFFFLNLIPQALATEVGVRIKIAYAGTLMVAAAVLVSQVSKPGVSGRQAIFVIAGVIFCMLLAVAGSYFGTTETERVAALMGHSWLVCPWAILGLSIPIMLGSFWAIKGLAPTNLPLAGAACGLFSGAVAAIAYALACTETATPFIAIWYTLGIGLSVALGAKLGQRLLNW